MSFEHLRKKMLTDPASTILSQEFNAAISDILRAMGSPLWFLFDSRDREQEIAEVLLRHLGPVLDDLADQLRTTQDERDRALVICENLRAKLADKL